MHCLSKSQSQAQTVKALDKMTPAENVQIWWYYALVPILKLQEKAKRVKAGSCKELVPSMSNKLSKCDLDIVHRCKKQSKRAGGAEWFRDDQCTLLGSAWF